MGTSNTTNIRRLIPGHEVLVNGVRCYAAASYANLRIGFEPIDDKADVLWVEGWRHKAGQAFVTPGSKVKILNYYLTSQSEIDAFRVVMDARDRLLFPECGIKAWTDRKIINQWPRETVMTFASDYAQYLRAQRRG